MEAIVCESSSLYPITRQIIYKIVSTLIWNLVSIDLALTVIKEVFISSALDTKSSMHELHSVLAPDSSLESGTETTVARPISLLVGVGLANCNGRPEVNRNHGMHSSSFYWEKHNLVRWSLTLPRGLMSGSHSYIDVKNHGV